MNTWHHRHSGLAARSRGRARAGARRGLVSIGTRQGRRTRGARTGRVPRSSGTLGQRSRTQMRCRSRACRRGHPSRRHLMQPTAALPDARVRPAALRRAQSRRRCSWSGRFAKAFLNTDWSPTSMSLTPGRPKARCPRESRLQPSLSARRCERRLRRDCSPPRGLRRRFRMPPVRCQRAGSPSAPPFAGRVPQRCPRRRTQPKCRQTRRRATSA